MMQTLKIIFLSCCIALTAGEEVGEITAANFTTFSAEPQTRAIGRFNTFRISTFSASWYEAMLHCSQNFAKLVSIGDYLFDQSIRQGLLGQRITTPVWTSGKRDYDIGGPFEYIWATSGRPIIYSNWDRSNGEPWNDWGINACVTTKATGYLDTQYTWQTAQCYTRLRFVCLTTDVDPPRVIINI